jgi:hypothetical protein
VLAAFLCLRFRFVLYWRETVGAKAAHRMLVKLTPGLEGGKAFRKSWIVVANFFERNTLAEKIAI